MCDEFDVVHIHSIEPICLQELLISKYLDCKPTVATLFSIGGWIRHPRLPIRITVGPYERIALRLVRRADIFHVKNEGDKVMLIELGFNANRVLLIPDGVPRQAFDNFDGNAFRNEYGLVNKKNRIVRGRLHHAKSIHILIKAMAEVIKDRSDATARAYTNPNYA